MPTPITKGVVICRIAFGKLLVGPTAEDRDERDEAALVPGTLEALRRRGEEILPALKTHEFCTLFGVPMECLPRVTPSTGDLGGVRAGDASVPLAASLVDQQAATCGHGCRRAGDAKITFGAGAFAILGRSCRPIGTAACRPSPGPRRARLPPMPWTAGSMRRARQWTGRGASAFSATWTNWADLGPEPAILRGLSFVPALAGLAYPHWNRRARGAWMGLGLGTTRRDMMQALLEGTALRMAEAAGLELEVRQRGRLVEPRGSPREWRPRLAAARAAVEAYGAQVGEGATGQGG